MWPSCWRKNNKRKNSLWMEMAFLLKVKPNRNKLPKSYMILFCPSPPNWTSSLYGTVSFPLSATITVWLG